MLDGGIRMICPFVKSVCKPDCMMFLSFADADVLNKKIDDGKGSCSIAVLASHAASEQHAGGNYLMNVVGYHMEDRVEDSDD
jgi:hypothetical protein